MVRSLMIALDGSAFSDVAVELGLEWGRHFDALVVGLGIIDEPTIRQWEAVPLGAGAFKEHRDEVRIEWARRQVEQFLERFALRASEAQVAFKVLEDVGLPSDRILLESQRYDLIILGKKTNFHFATREGSDETLQSVLRNTPRPVVIVPERLPAGGSGTLIAYDGSMQAARALQSFQSSGLGGNGPVHVLSVGADHTDAARHVHRAVEFLGFHEIAARAHVASPSPTVADTLLQHAAQLQSRLLVMGAYGQPTLREFFLGSATRLVLQKTSLPVFLYH
jgi:nucleotide-binding universal stress UspA family protein